jgi:hypothetical protein
VLKPEEIRELLDARPFEPFRIHLSDGSAFDVKHPEMVLVARTHLDIGVAGDPEQKIAERIVRCALLHVVKLDPSITRA